MPTNDELRQIFTYHAPTDEQRSRYVAIRDSAFSFAQVINETVPDCADKSAALRKLRECVMTANAAIALEHTLSGQTKPYSTGDAICAGQLLKLRDEPFVAYDVVHVTAPNRVLIRKDGDVVLACKHASKEGWAVEAAPWTSVEKRVREQILSPAPTGGDAS